MSGCALHERQFVGTAHQNARQAERLTGRQADPLRRLVIARPCLEHHPRSRQQRVLAELAEPERDRVVHAHTDRLAVQIAAHTVEKRGFTVALVPRQMTLRIRVAAVRIGVTGGVSHTTASHGRTVCLRRSPRAKDRAARAGQAGRYGQSWVGPPARFRGSIKARASVSALVRAASRRGTIDVSRAP